MNKMSEDEIINIIKKQLTRKANYDTGVHLPQLAVEGLLDLYKQEKEKNKELEKENERLKYLITESCKIIDEYTNKLENDTKKIIEYREKYLKKRIKNNK